MFIPKVIALVPMKGHSERVPNKNIRLLAGKPAFHWILEALSQCKYIEQIVINTDSDEIIESACSKFNVTILKRPTFLQGDMVGIQPLIAYDISHTNGDYYLQTHATNPLIQSNTIDNAIESFFRQSQHDSLFTVTSIKSRFYWPNGKEINHNKNILLRTQDLDPIFEENSCFYLFSRGSNSKYQNRIGINPMMFPVNRLEAVDIDEMEDFYYAEFLLNKYVHR